MANLYRKFEQFQEPTPAVTQPFFMWKNSSSDAHLPAAPSHFFPQPQYPGLQHQELQYQRVANNLSSAWPQQPYAPQFAPQYTPQQQNPQYMPQQSSSQYNHWQFQSSLAPVSNKFFTPLPKVAKLKASVWEDFKRIYITEVIAFTMSKSTLFTLIFSFMFLGCIFFLSGFFTATNIYREQNVVHEAARQHTPTETALLQGRPERIVNMGAGIAFATPRAYQYQGGVKIDQNRRRPTEYAERQIASHHPHYR